MASSSALPALDIVLQEWLQTKYPLGPSAAAFKSEAKTVFALKKTCRRLSQRDSSEWEMGDGGVCFSYFEALEEAKYADPESFRCFG